MDKPKRQRGRPKSPDPASTRLQIRVTKAEKAVYEWAAWKAGVTLTAWVKALCDREVS